MAVDVALTFLIRLGPVVFPAQSCPGLQCSARAPSILGTRYKPWPVPLV